MGNDIGDEREAELREGIIEGIFTGDLEQVHEFQRALNDVQERQPKPDDGRYQIRFGSTAYRHETTATCPDCGKVLHASGISFYQPGEFGMPTHEELLIGTHRTEKCPVLKWRLYRLKWRVYGRRWEQVKWKWRKFKRKRARRLSH